MLGQTMGGELMSTAASAFRVHHLVCYKASDFFIFPFHLFPSSPLLLFFRRFQLCSAFSPNQFFFRG